jgi:uncharacterized spore protein YtfJ
MHLKDTLEALAERLQTTGVRTVYGDPISAEGRTIIPVARVAYGFGGGGGTSGTPAAPAPNLTGEGAGGGGGGHAVPVGAGAGPRPGGPPYAGGVPAPPAGARRWAW